MEEKRGKDDNDIEVLCREYQEGKISKVELDKKLGNLFDKNFPMFAKGFFRFNGQIFMAKEVRKKIFAIALRTLADKIEHGVTPTPVTKLFTHEMARS